MHITTITYQESDAGTETIDVPAPGAPAAGVAQPCMSRNSHPSRANSREPNVQRVAQTHPKTQLDGRPAYAGPIKTRGATTVAFLWALYLWSPLLDS